MPGRLSPSPPVLPRASNPDEAMSLAEMSRPVPETHLLQPTLSYMTAAPDPRNLCEPTSGTSQTALPPLQTRRFNELAYNTYRHDLDQSLRQVHYNQQGAATTSNRTLQHSSRSLDISPTNSRPSEQHLGIGRERRPEPGSSPPEPVIKQDDSEEVSYLNQPLVTLPSPSFKQTSPTSTVLGNTTVNNRQELHDIPPRGDISKQMGIPSLISNNDSRFETQLPVIVEG